MRFIVTTILIALLNIHVVLADAPELLVDRASISEVSASAAERGGKSKLRMIIRNDSGMTLSLLGVSSPVAEFSALRGRTGATESTDFQSMAIPGDETLNLNSTHLRVTLSPLNQALMSGEDFSITIHFVEGDVLALAHVH